MRNKYGLAKTVRPRAYNPSLPQRALVWAKLAHELGEDIDDALDAYNARQITGDEYRAIRTKLREAKWAAEERMEMERRRAIAIERFHASHRRRR